jgi:hypothetical protein
MPTPNTLKIRSSGGKSQMKIIPAPDYNPNRKAPSRRDLHRMEVADKKHK